MSSEACVEGDGINTIEWVEQDWTAHCAIESSLGCTKVQYVQGTDGAWHRDEADDHSRPLSYLCVATNPIGEGVPRDVHG